MAKRPWFPFYPADWMTDSIVQSMTWEEQGIYIHLLGLQWREGGIPDNYGRLANIIGVSLPVFKKKFSDMIFSLFIIHDEETNTLRNKRLEEIRKDADAAHDRLAESGRKGGLVKNKAGSKPGLSTSEADLQSQKEVPSPARVKAPRGRNCDPQKLQDSWLKHTGNPGFNGLLDVANVVEIAARSKEPPADPDEHADKAIAAFVAWIDGIRPKNRQPRKAPDKFVEHAARIFEIVDGKREAVPKDTTPKKQADEKDSPLQAEINRLRLIGKAKMDALIRREDS